MGTTGRNESIFIDPDKLRRSANRDKIMAAFEELRDYMDELEGLLDEAGDTDADAEDREYAREQSAEKLTELLDEADVFAAMCKQRMAE